MVSDKLFEPRNSVVFKESLALLKKKIKKSLPGFILPSDPLEEPLPLCAAARAPGPASKGQGSLGSSVPSPQHAFLELRVSWGRTLAQHVRSLSSIPIIIHTHVFFPYIFMAGLLL